MSKALVKKSIEANPAFWFFMVFAAGIAFGWQSLNRISFAVFAGFSLLSFILTIIAHKKFPACFPALIAFSVFFSAAALLEARLTFFAPNHLINEPLYKIRKVRGWIAGEMPRESGRDRYIMRCQAVYRDSQWHEARGHILLIRGKRGLRLHYGDRVQFKAPLLYPPLPSNPGEFNYRRYLQLNHIYFRVNYNRKNLKITGDKAGPLWQRRFFVPLRKGIRQTITHYFHQPTRAVFKALVLGERQDVERSLMNNFRRSGVIHILAISGLHVGFLLAMLLLLLGFLPLTYPQRILLTLLFLWLFAALVDFKAPVVRAVLMATIYFSAQLTERSAGSLNPLGVAGLLILIVEPQQLLLPGFQFSFAAVGSILYGYPKLQKVWPMDLGHSHWKERFNSYLRQPFLVSLAAILGTIPLTWSYYGTLQVGAVLVNLLVIPLMAVFVMLCFLFLLLSGIGFWACAGLAFSMEHYFKWIARIIAFFARQPWVQIELTRPSFLSLIFLIALLLLLVNLNNKRNLLTTVIVASVFFVSVWNHHLWSKGRLWLLQVNVGQGDGAIVQFPNGRVMVVDGGDYKYHFDAGKRYMVPTLKYLGIHRIQYLVGTHVHSDHIGGFLSLLNNLEVDTLALSPYTLPTPLVNRLRVTARKRNIPVRFLRRGQQLYADGDCRVYVLHPFGKYTHPVEKTGREINNSSIVLKVQYKATSFLLTGDLERSAEPAIMRYNRFLQSDYLKVGHHGSITSTSLPFLARVRPRFSVVSVGAHNKYFHPSQQTMLRLRKAGAHPMRTDHFGAAMFYSDGQAIHFINWRAW